MHAAFVQLGPHILDVVQLATVDIVVVGSNRLDQCQSREGLLQVVGFALILHLHGAAHRAGQVAQQRLGQVHQVAVIGVGLVELQHGELGVVTRAQPLVTKIPVDLVHALEAANHQPLEIQLRRNAQEIVTVHDVVMGHEWLGRGTARQRVHHRCFDFHEAERVHELPNELNDLRALSKHLANFGVHDQVDIALAVALLGVGEAGPFFGQRAQAFGQ